MFSKIFLNLPVKDLEKSKAFFQALGFSFNPQFSDDTAACMVVSESIYGATGRRDPVAPVAVGRGATANE